MKHVELYVNDWTMDLGKTGRDALRQLSNRAAAVGLVERRKMEIEVFGGSI
jgi:1,4-dihydroxy-6-naphthoate synthase